MTSGGYERLVDELKHLKTLKRPQVIPAMPHARAHADPRAAGPAGWGRGWSSSGVAAGPARIAAR